MERKRAIDLARSIARQIKTGTTIDIRKLRQQECHELNLLPHLGSKHVLAVFEISKDDHEYWLALVNWRPSRPGNYYMVTFGRDGNIKILCEFHKIDGFELNWRYRPSKRDTQNKERVRRFTEMYGSTEVRISLPVVSISVDEFLTDVLRVAEIRKAADDLSAIVRLDENGTFPEGRRIERLHKSRERSPRVVSEAKKRHARTHNGKLPCEICGFDFRKVYGDRGRHFIEAHHKVPLNMLEEGQHWEATVDDLALVCANCHRMLHKNPYSTVEDLKARLPER